MPLNAALEIIPLALMEPANTLIVGMTGAGKTTLALRYLVNIEPACRFLFDESSRWSRRLPIRPCFTLNECEASLPSRWNLYNPMREFPGDYAFAMERWLEWVFEACTRGPGPKILAVQELWQWCDTRTMSRALRMCCQAGREYGIQLLLDTQEPHRINSSVIGQTTELITFRLQEPKAWDCVRELGGDVEKVKRLPLGQFIALNRLSGGTLSGRVF